LAKLPVSFSLRKDGVQVEVLEWVGELEPFCALKGNLDPDERRSP